MPRSTTLRSCSALCRRWPRWAVPCGCSGEGNRPELAYQINISEALLRPGSDESSRHMRLLTHVAQSGEPQLVPPMSGTESEEAGGNPTSYLLVLAPLAGDGRLEGVIEVFQRPDSQPATQRGYLRFLIQMCELASEWLKSRKLKHFSNRHSLWAQADQFARMVHEDLDVRETAYTIVNEGRRLIGCDRVSVAIKRGRVCKIEAISGQDTIESRSNIVTMLGKVATRVVATGESLWYEGNTEDLPPQVEEAIDAYVDESYCQERDRAAAAQAGRCRRYRVRRTGTPNWSAKCTWSVRSSVP